MFLDRCRSLNDFDLIGRDVEKIFSDFFPFHSDHGGNVRAGAKSPETKSVAPAIDMIDKGASIAVLVDMPGINKENVVITIDKNILTIKAEREKREEKKDEQYLHMERGRYSLSRSVRLPVKIDADKITASLREGILEVTLSKAPEVKPRKIKVEVN